MQGNKPRLLGQISRLGPFLFFFTVCRQLTFSTEQGREGGGGGTEKEVEMLCGRRDIMVVPFLFISVAVM